MAGGRKILFRGEAERALAATKRSLGQYRTCAIAARADQCGAMIVLQRAGNDFGGGRRSGIDENHNALAIAEITGLDADVLGVARGAAADCDDSAAVEERVAYRNCAVQDATGIIAQIDNIAFELVGRNRGGDL